MLTLRTKAVSAKRTERDVSSRADWQAEAKAAEAPATELQQARSSFGLAGALSVALHAKGLVWMFTLSVRGGRENMPECAT